MENVARLNASRGQFVILRHEMPMPFQQQSHWDFMLEDGDLLLTFRLLKLPENPPPGGSQLSSQACRVQRISDHRREYLVYQGRISGGRGRVRRIAGGEYTALRETSRLAETSREIYLALSSDRLSARIQFELCAVGQFTQIKFLDWEMLAEPPNASSSHTNGRIAPEADRQC